MLSSASRHASQSRCPATRIQMVCVVDPKADDYSVWGALAEAKGARLEIVASAHEALRLARTAAVDLWVVNTELPGVSGCELCNMLKARLPNTPVYLVADEYSPQSERAALAARATMFGCKPAHVDWLTEW